MVPNLLEAASIATWRKIYKISTRIGKFAKTGSQVVSLIQNVKELLAEVENEPEPRIDAPIKMERFRPTIQDSYNKGRQWIPELQNMAGNFGNPWIPKSTQGWGGIDLTGVWLTYQTINELSYIRQFGPYLNWITEIGGYMPFYHEGLFDQEHSVVHMVGQGFGMLSEIRADLYTDWTLRGEMTVQDSYERRSSPMAFVKIA
jgi:hypothetical protein